MGFAKSFVLKRPTKNKDNWTLSFVWHDDLEGRQLLKDAILKTLVNIRNAAKENIDVLATAVDTRNSREVRKTVFHQVLIRLTFPIICEDTKQSIRN